MKARPNGPSAQRVNNNMADILNVLSETVGKNRATGKTSHKCCAAALCTNRSDNRKDLTLNPRRCRYC